MVSFITICGAWPPDASLTLLFLEIIPSSLEVLETLDFLLMISCPSRVEMDLCAFVCECMLFLFSENILMYLSKIPDIIFVVDSFLRYCIRWEVAKRTEVNGTLHATLYIHGGFLGIKEGSLILIMLPVTTY